MPKQEINTFVKKDLAMIISVYFFLLVGIVSLFTILFSGFVTFVLPDLNSRPESAQENQITFKPAGETLATDRHFETIK